MESSPTESVEKLSQADRFATFMNKRWFISHSGDQYYSDIETEDDRRAPKKAKGRRRIQEVLRKREEELGKGR
jgi:hypothetical protein